MSHQYQFSVVIVSNKRILNNIKLFLSKNELQMEDDIEQFVVAWKENQIIACGGIAGHVLKCIAIDSLYRGDGLSLTLITELLNMAFDLGRAQLFLFTRPQNEPLFNQAGFHTLAKVPNQLILMENSQNRLQKYCQQLAKLKKVGSKIGAIVMNANPFTLGHRYLIEQASQQCDWLHLFLVKEDVSVFSYLDRLQLVKDGTADIENSLLHQGSDYMISKATFPSYFIKDKGVITRCHAAIDLQIFRHYLAPALGITHRFVGSEPFDPVTNDYNQQMKQDLGDPQCEYPIIKLVEIPRLVIEGEVVSASRVRRALLLERKWDEIAKLVPSTTKDFLISRFS